MTIAHETPFTPGQLTTMISRLVIALPGTLEQLAASDIDIRAVLRHTKEGVRLERALAMGLRALYNGHAETIPEDDDCLTAIYSKGKIHCFGVIKGEEFPDCEEITLGSVLAEADRRGWVKTPAKMVKSVHNKLSSYEDGQRFKWLIIVHEPIPGSVEVLPCLSLFIWTPDGWRRTTMSDQMLSNRYKRNGGFIFLKPN